MLPGWISRTGDVYGHQESCPAQGIHTVDVDQWAPPSWDGTGEEGGAGGGAGEKEEGLEAIVGRWTSIDVFDIIISDNFG